MIDKTIDCLVYKELQTVVTKSQNSIFLFILADNKLTDTHITTEDIELIASEINSVQDSYKTAISTMKGAQKQLDSELKSQTKTKWELEHQNKLKTSYEEQLDQVKKDIATMRSHLPMMSETCFIFYILILFIYMSFTVILCGNRRRLHTLPTRLAFNGLGVLLLPFLERSV